MPRVYTADLSISVVHAAYLYDLFREYGHSPQAIHPHYVAIYNVCPSAVLGAEGRSCFSLDLIVFQKYINCANVTRKGSKIVHYCIFSDL